MTDTFVAILTPSGKCALATLGLRGPGAWPVVRDLFRPRTGKALPEQPASQHRWLGQLGDDITDEAVLVVRGTEPIVEVELHVHGGREVSRYLVEVLLARGLRSCTWQEYLAYQEADPLRAAAALALTQATTSRVASIVLDQHQGALRREVARVREALESGNVGSARDVLATLLRWVPLGLHLTTPFRVVVAGAPNAGKSSLVNTLAGYQRSIVAATPGTTRDVVTTALAIDGWPIDLSDTAGLRQGSECLEEQGIERARQAIAAADLVVWLVDSTVTPVWPGVEATNLHVVVNKIDLPSAWDQTLAGVAPRVSATTGEGLDTLILDLSRWLVPVPPPPGAAVPFTTSQVMALEETSRLVVAGQVAQALAGLDRLLRGEPAA